jgi:hypothetical protein
MASAKLNRRKFIRYTAAIGGGVALSPVLHIPSVAKGNTQRDIYWYQQSLCILQTALREPDASNYDAKAVVAYMAKTGCNTLIGSVELKIDKLEDYFAVHPHMV